MPPVATLASFLMSLLYIAMRSVIRLSLDEWAGCSCRTIVLISPAVGGLLGNGDGRLPDAAELRREVPGVWSRGVTGTWERSPPAGKGPEPEGQRLGRLWGDKEGKRRTEGEWQRGSWRWWLWLVVCPLYSRELGGIMDTSVVDAGCG